MDFVETDQKKMTTLTPGSAAPTTRCCQLKHSRHLQRRSTTTLKPPGPPPPLPPPLPPSPAQHQEELRLTCEPPLLTPPAKLPTKKTTTTTKTAFPTTPQGRTGKLSGEAAWFLPCDDMSTRERAFRTSREGRDVEEMTRCETRNVVGRGMQSWD